MNAVWRVLALKRLIIMGLMFALGTATAGMIPRHPSLRAYCNSKPVGLVPTIPEPLKIETALPCPHCQMDETAGNRASAAFPEGQHRRGPTSVYDADDWNRVPGKPLE